MDDIPVFRNWQDVENVFKIAECALMHEKETITANLNLTEQEFRRIKAFVQNALDYK